MDDQTFPTLEDAISRRDNLARALPQLQRELDQLEGYITALQGLQSLTAQGNGEVAELKPIS